MAGKVYTNTANKSEGDERESKRQDKEGAEREERRREACFLVRAGTRAEASPHQCCGGRERRMRIRKRMRRIHNGKKRRHEHSEQERQQSRGEDKRRIEG